MASEQVKKFLSDGVIINSINFPKVSLGRTTKYRMVIIHKDEPGVIGMLAGEVAAEGINIPDMINKSRNEIAITLIDLEKEPSKNIISNIKNMETVLSIRVC
jgi:D-3-phosphoglycerate dehydrogenase